MAYVRDEKEKFEIEFSYFFSFLFNVFYFVNFFLKKSSLFLFQKKKIKKLKNKKVKL